MERVGIVGLPNAGKSSLFNFLTDNNVPAESFPFCTIEPNVGILGVRDERVEILARNEGSRKVVHPFVEIVDIAGLVKGASKGEGLGNQFLDHISKVDVIAHVVRVFESKMVSHPYQSVDPKRDIEIVETELILKDLETVQKRLEKRVKIARAGDRDARREVKLLQALQEFLSQGKRASRFPRRDEFEENVIRSLFLLTDKPQIFVFNVDELSDERKKLIESTIEEKGEEYIIINVKLEEELKALPEDEAELFRAEYNLSGDKKKEFFEKVLRLLDLVRFLTATQNEARSWTMKKGSTAYEAAGLIHTDMQRGFIKVEVIPFERYLEYGSLKKAREAGAVETHGKDYIVREGDVIHFLFRA
ncbi:redox-regulated ATPase YchF [Thermotoga sp.]|uniref:redox-regulated ATPase YchF n=1 Tax=Thermotoga sp. TaxID=28240 RepID=UPI002A1F2E06|nr:redox-regulated ATPase YchF [Thermotoga sp.]